MVSPQAKLLLPARAAPARYRPAWARPPHAPVPQAEDCSPARPTLPCPHLHPLQYKHNNETLVSPSSHTMRRNLLFLLTSLRARGRAVYMYSHYSLCSSCEKRELGVPRLSRQKW